jgi:hypothetical protein
MDIKEKFGEVVKEKFSKENLKPKTGKKKILLGVFVILLGALGLEVSNTDFDLGSIFSGNSISDSAVMRDSNGNLQTDANGNLITKVMRNKAGDVVTDGSGKATDEYNCADFSTQTEAQSFFVKAGGVSKDTNRLDGNNDGVACQDLPKK